MADTPAPPAEPTDDLDGFQIAVDAYGVPLSYKTAKAALDQQAEPSDEALIGKVRAFIAGTPLAWDDANMLEGVAARLAAKDEALAKEQATNARLQSAYMRAAEERTLAEAALAECRAKTIEECARIADAAELDIRDDAPSTGNAIRALAKEAKA